MQTGDADGVRTVAPSVLRSCLGVADGYLLIHAAAEHGYDACIAALAECGAGGTLSAVTEYGHTAASLAAKNGHTSCLNELVEQGAISSLLFAAVGPCKRTPTHLAAEKGHTRGA
jgi:hypothetical protein